MKPLITELSFSQVGFFKQVICQCKWAVGVVIK